jgi:carotenoid cleavage dioxygenase
MLHGLDLADGRATYRNRWIRTRGLAAEMAVGRALYHGLSDVMNFPDEALVGDAGPVKNRANTHIVRHAGKLFALWEQGPPTEIEPDLGTVGEWDFGGKLGGAMTAHPRIDPRTGEMFAFSYNLFPPYLTYYVVDAAGRLVHRVDLDLPAPVMMHDFLITEDHAVFLDSPVTFDVEAVGSGESMTQWRPENGSRLGVMPRLGTADDISWYEVETSHVQHFWNAWVDGNRIELAGCRFPEVNFGFDDAEIETIGAPAARYWIDLDAGRAGWEPIDDMIGEMCRVNDERIGVRTDCLYMSGFTREGATAGDFDSIVKYDTTADTRTSWYAGDTCHLGENVFAPDPDGTAEDDGWIINSMHDDADGGHSEVVILDARDIAAGPVARVRTPQRMPFGFHANWFAARPE